MSDHGHDETPRPDAPREHEMGDHLGDEGGDMDALDRLITTSARDYHRPPPPAAVPREAMWEAIMAARTSAGAPATPLAAAPELRVVRATAAPTPATRRWVDRRWMGLAAAAGLFLATGIGIGRWWGDSRVAAGPDAPGGQIAAGVPQQPADTQLGAAPRAGASAEGSETTPDALPTRDVAVRRPGTAAAVGTERVAATPATLANEGSADAADPAYDDAALRHFAAAEALLVSFRAGAPAAMSDSMSGALDGRLSSWARQLLQDTRLLLDSPAGEDPRRRRLLEDLELVLAQITRLGAAAEATRPQGSVAERELIDGTIRRGQVLSRLRSAAPAGT